ncbi:MAG: amino acid adenylation domain-containing protein, partial [Polyangiaceae bacterium]
MTELERSAAPLGILHEPIPVVVRDGTEAPLSYAQQQLWFLQSLDRGLTAYNLPRAFRIKGELRVDALERAFQAVIARHAVLRSRFIERDGLVQQVVLDSVPFTLQMVPLSELPPEEREARLQSELRRVADHVFDLQQAPALVAQVIQLGAEDHVLVLCLHHITSDAWSSPILARDLATAYRLALSQAGNALLPDLLLQYADFATWQRALAESGGLAQEIAYWNDSLGADVPVLDLPTDFPRPERPTFAGAELDFELSPGLCAKLLRLCKNERFTPFVPLLAAWQVLLSRYAGRSDFGIGVPNAGRHREELSELIGFFVTTQVFRARLLPQQTLRDLCQKIRAQALGALAHPELPFDLLLASRAERRDPARSPLFQVMFGLQMDDAQTFALPGLSVSPVEVSGSSAKYELSLDFVVGERGARGRLEYNSDLFSRSSAQRLVEQYQRVLEQLAREPSLKLADIELLSESERYLLTDVWGKNAARYPSAVPIPQLFAQRAQERPEASAVMCGAAELSYGELDRRANRLAQRLVSLGVRAEVRVGIAVERSVEMVIALLAVLKAGGAYVPLDPTYPADRLAFMIEDSGIDLLLTQTGIRIESERALVRLDLDSLDLSGEGETNPVCAVHPANLAYVIYTSGSTGKPKGIGITHGTFAEHCQIGVEFFALTALDRMLQFSTINFDASVEQLFCPLIVGAAVVLRGPTIWDSQTFYRELIEKRISVTDLPTAYWQMLAQDFARQPRDDYGAWRQAQAMGEAMPPEGLRYWRDAGLSHVKLLNTYGPTETVVTATVHDCTPYAQGTEPLPAVMPIGGPLAGRCLYVLGGDLSLLPQGVAGELYIGGELLARGYQRRAGLTAERFVADPFASNGGRLYRTGDLVRWRTEGSLDYLGRVDDQVKIRGFRIELGEVEAQLMTQPGVREAVAVAKLGPTGARLIAYITTADHSIELDSLRARLAQALPEYMVPSAIVVLPELPLTPNGKLDRKALPDPELGLADDYETPHGEVEEKLAAVWSELLRVPRVGRRDNFFELGGHSLLAIQVLARLRSAGLFGEVSGLFQRPELAAFAHTLSRSGAAGQASVPPNLIPADCSAIQPEMLPLVELNEAQLRSIEALVPGGALNIQDIYPLAPLQEGILFHHLMQEQGDVYVTPCLLSFDSESRLVRFVQCLNRVIARHDILRTAVLWEGLPEPIQVVHRQASVEIEWLASEPGDGDLAERLKNLAHPSQCRIDVRRAPMIQALAVADPAQQRWLLQLPSHHLVLDHATLDLLVEEIAQIERGESATLPKPLPFRNLIARIRSGAGTSVHEAFFREMLADVSEPTAPFGVVDVYGVGSRIS